MNTRATRTKKNEWISTMVTAFTAEEAASPKTVGAIVVDRQVSIIYLDTDKPKIGVAKCNPTDAFDLATGLAIAYARANGKTVPDYVLHDGTPFTEVAIGTQFVHGDKRYIKVDNIRAYCYNDGNVYYTEGNDYVVVR